MVVIKSHFFQDTEAKNSRQQGKNPEMIRHPSFNPYAGPADQTYNEQCPYQTKVFTNLELPTNVCLTYKNEFQ
ncbi:uncharacterized protein LOC111122495 isoform X2 [Crassostrea virginica]